MVPCSALRNAPRDRGVTSGSRVAECCIPAATAADVCPCGYGKRRTLGATPGAELGSIDIPESSTYSAGAPELGAEEKVGCGIARGFVVSW